MAVFSIGTPLDQARLFQAIQHFRDGGRLHAHALDQLRLGQPLLAPEMPQNHFLPCIQTDGCQRVTHLAALSLTNHAEQEIDTLIFGFIVQGVLQVSQLNKLYTPREKLSSSSETYMWRTSPGRRAKRCRVA